MGGDTRRGTKRTRTDSGSELCRDYNKGTCFRANRCKFTHPDDENPEDKRIPFCKDFRYSTCKFRDCVYIHAPELLEKEYLNTGWIPRFVLKHALDRFNLCIQYLKENGGCQKQDCKFGHSMLGLKLRPEDFEFSSQSNHGLSVEQLAKTTGLCLDYSKDSCEETECKYKHLSPKEAGVGNENTTWSIVRERESNNGYIRSGKNGGLLDNVDAGPGSMTGSDKEELMMLRRENEMMRMELMDLRKKNEGLQATNQFLLDENAGMRMRQAGYGGGYDYNSGTSSTSGYGGAPSSGYRPGSSPGYGGASAGYGGPSSGGGYGAAGAGSGYNSGATGYNTSPGYSNPGAGASRYGNTGTRRFN